MKKLFRRLVSALLLISAFAPSIQALDKPANLYIIGNLDGDKWCENAEVASNYKMTSTANGFSLDNVKFTGDNGTAYFRFAADHKTGDCNQYGRKDSEGPYSSSNSLAATGNCFTIDNGTYNVSVNFTDETITLTSVGGNNEDPEVNCDGWYIKLNGDQNKQVGLNSGNTVAKWSAVELHNGSNTEFYIQIWDGSNNKNYSTGGAITLGTWMDCTESENGRSYIGGGQGGEKFDIEFNAATKKIKVTKVEGPVVNCDGWYIKIKNGSNTTLREVQLNNGNTIAEFSGISLYSDGKTEFYIQVYNGSKDINYSSNSGGVPFNEWIQCVTPKTSNMYDGGGNAGRTYDIKYNAATNQLWVSQSVEGWTVPANLYLMGEGEGLDWGDSRKKGTKSGNVFTFYGVKLTGQFNFHEDPSGWAEKRYGNAQNVGALELGLGESAEIKFLKNQADKNFKVKTEGDYDVIVNFDNMTVTLREKTVSSLYMIGNTVGMKMKAMAGTRVGDDPETHVFQFNHIYSHPTSDDTDGYNGCFRFHTSAATDTEDYLNFFGPADTDEELVVTLGTPMALVRCSEETGRRAFRFTKTGHYDITVDIDNMTVLVKESPKPKIPNNLYIIGHVNTQQQAAFNFNYMNQTSRHSYREDKDGTRNPDGKVFVFENVLMRDNENTGLSAFTFRTNTSNLQWTAAHPDQELNVANVVLPYELDAEGDQVFDAAGFPVNHFRIVYSQNRKGSWMLPSGYAYDLRVDFTDYDETGDVRLYVKQTVALPSELYLIRGKDKQIVTKMKSKVEGEFYLTNLNLSTGEYIGLSLDNGNNPDYCPSVDKTNIVLVENTDEGYFEYEDEGANYKNNNMFWYVPEGAKNVDIFVTFPYDERDGSWDGADPVFRVVQRKIDESLIPNEIYLTGRLRDWNMDVDIDPVCVPKLEYDERDRTFTCTALLKNEEGKDYAEFRFYTSADAKTNSHEFGLVADSSKKLITFDSNGNSTDEYAIIPATEANKYENNWRVAGVDGVYLTFTISYADPEHPVLTVNKEPDFLSFFFAGDLVTYDKGGDGKKSDQTWLTGDRKYQFQKSDLPDEALRSWKNGWYMLKLPVLNGQFKISKNTGTEWKVAFGHTAKKKEGDQLVDPEEYFANPVVIGEEYTAITSKGDGANLHLQNNVLENVTIYFKPDVIEGVNPEYAEAYGNPRLFITADKAYDLYYFFYNQSLMTEDNIKEIVNNNNVGASDYIGLSLSKKYKDADGKEQTFKMPANRFYNTDIYTDEDGNIVDPTQFILVDLAGTDDLALIAREDLTLMNFGLSADRPEYDPRRYVMMAKIPSGLEMSAGIAYRMVAENVGSNRYLSENEMNPQTIPSTKNVYVLSAEFAPPVSVYIRQDYGNSVMNAAHANDVVEVSYRLIDIETVVVNGSPVSDYVVVSTKKNNPTLFKDADAWGYMPFNAFHQKGSTKDKNRHNNNVDHTDMSATTYHNNIYHGHYPDKNATDAAVANKPLNLGVLYPNAYVQFRIVRRISDWGDINWKEDYPEKLCKLVTDDRDGEDIKYYKADPAGTYLVDYYPAAEAAMTSSSPAGKPARVLARAGVKIPTSGQSIGKDVDPFMEISDNYKLNSTPMYATVDVSKESITVGIEEVEDDFGYGSAEFDGEPVYFTIEGIQVAEPSAPGVYIVVRGSHSEKIVVE